MGPPLRVFVAGATGVIGRVLIPLLLRAGHAVTGTTRSAQRAEALSRSGASAVVVDVYDGVALCEAVERARPDVVIHQLTDLPDRMTPEERAAALERNARMRIAGTNNLLVAAVAAGVGRVVAQSIAFVYAPGPPPHLEDAPLLPGPTADAVRSLEAGVTSTDGMAGLVLRYGRLYGPGTWTPVPEGTSPLHVDAAAHAAFLAIHRGTPGVYNIAEDADGVVCSDKARRELGFDPAYRRT